MSPLYGKFDDKYPQYNTDFTIQMVKREGADPSKIIVGVPFYGQSFTLMSEVTNRLVGEGAAARGPGKPGEYTKQPGMLAYYEICKRIKDNGWRKGREASQKSGPFAVSGDQWVGFEDYESVAAKAKYVVDSGLGGIAAWTVDLDDFSNLCCSESFPLLKSINRVFNRIPPTKPVSGDCQRPVEPVTPQAPITTTLGPDGVFESAEHTTWPSWNPSSTTSKPSSQITWEPTQSTSTTIRTPTSMRPSPTTTENANEIGDDIIPVPVNTMPVSGGPCNVDGKYKRHPYSCNKYYQCVYNQYIEYSCAGGLHWHEKGNLCDWPASARCKERTPTQQNAVTKAPQRTTISTETRATQKTTATTRTTYRTTQRTTKKPSGKPYSTPSSSEPCNNGAYRANIDDCESFFICVNQKWIRQDCGYGLQFDQVN